MEGIPCIDKGLSEVELHTRGKLFLDKSPILDPDLDILFRPAASLDSLIVQSLMAAGTAKQNPIEQESTVIVEVVKKFLEF
jgi:hypothetical protein